MFLPTAGTFLAVIMVATNTVTAKRIQNFTTTIMPALNVG